MNDWGEDYAEEPTGEAKPAEAPAKELSFKPLSALTGEEPKS